MNNTQEQVKGYNKLTEQQIASMNALKKDEADILQVLEVMKSRPEINSRSLAIAITNIQTGFMWAVRAVARPNGE